MEPTAFGMITAPMTRILTLTNWYPPHSLGGYEIECRDVMTRLHRRGHEVEILCSRSGALGWTTPKTEPATGPLVSRKLQMYLARCCPVYADPACAALHRAGQPGSG